MVPVKALVISPDAEVRRQLGVALATVERRTGAGWQVLEAADGLSGMRIAWREMPDLVVADEIASRAGAFAVARDLRGADRPFPGAIVIVLARRQDAWLAEWSMADAWVSRPLDPFELADKVAALVGTPEEVG